MMPRKGGRVAAVLGTIAALLPCGHVAAQNSTAAALRATVYTAPPFFPSSAFGSYYSGYGPNQTSVQPQPMVTNAVDGYVYPLNLTTGSQIVNSADPVIFVGNSTHPAVYNISYDTNLSTPWSISLRQQVVANISAIINGSSDSCTKCQLGVQSMKPLAVAAPWEVPVALIQLCIQFEFTSAASCQSTYEQSSDGAYITEVLSYADVTYPSRNSQMACHYYINSACPIPPLIPFNTTNWFAKPKPANAAVPKPSGELIKVAHISDIHLDPRYKIGGEANCSGYCCQPDSINSLGPNISFPAPRFGYFSCDSPIDLFGSAIGAIPALVGNDIAFTLFTGDMLVHLGDNQYGRELVEYSEDSVFQMMKYAVGGGPIYAALGNHDMYPDNSAAPSIVASSNAQYSWDYDQVAALWQNLGYINATQAQQVRTHYGGYSVVTSHGLKIITFNSEFWYRGNFYNYLSVDELDISGVFSWMRDELQAAEDAGLPVWIIGHVLSGWSGTNGLPAQTDLFYQMVDRYAPHVIRNIFFAHTHEDQFSIFYKNNGTNMTADNAVATAWIAPSITPLTSLNSGFREYLVDTGSWDVIDAFTYITNVSANVALDSQDMVGPTFQLEYSTRDAYGGNLSWPSNAPLNATFWHKFTEQLEHDPDLLSKFHTYQSKSSVKNWNCTNPTCQEAQVCYMRSGSTPLGQQCNPNYDSTQSKPKGS